jgi:hypothetical protein
MQVKIKMALKDSQKEIIRKAENGQCLSPNEYRTLTSIKIAAVKNLQDTMWLSIHLPESYYKKIFVQNDRAVTLMQRITLGGVAKLSANEFQTMLDAMKEEVTEMDMISRKNLFAELYYEPESKPESKKPFKGMSKKGLMLMRAEIDKELAEA